MYINLSQKNIENVLYLMAKNGKNKSKIINDAIEYIATIPTNELYRKVVDLNIIQEKRIKFKPTELINSWLKLYDTTIKNRIVNIAINDYTNYIKITQSYDTRNIL